jgi:peroxiredoxin (alkyl hydroperoxide reductase subunit C)
VVEDPSMAVGRAYGMIDADASDASAVRATYFIDPEGVIRAMTWYPMNVGRSVEEMVRMLAALQRTYGQDVLAPEGWQPGDDLLMPPDQVQDTVMGEAGADWFYRMKRDE